MRTSFAVMASAGLAVAQGQYGVVSQIADGQIQAPAFQTAPAYTAPAVVTSAAPAPPAYTAPAPAPAPPAPSAPAPAPPAYTPAPMPSAPVESAPAPAPPAETAPAPAPPAYTAPAPAPVPTTAAPAPAPPANNATAPAPYPTAGGNSTMATLTASKSTPAETGAVEPSGTAPAVNTGAAGSLTVNVAGVVAVFSLFAYLA